MSGQRSEAVQRLTDSGVRLGPIEDDLAALSGGDRPSAVALVNCLSRPEEAWPPLRALIEKAADGQWLSGRESTLLFHGLHILGAGRDSASCAPLLRLLRRPYEQLEDLLGDAITENLAKIIAGVFDGDAEALFALIAEPEVDEFIREAALGAATFLTWDGQIDLDLTTAFLVRIDEDRLAPEGDHLWVGWLEAIAHLGLRNLAPRVYRAWDDGRIPAYVLERKHFEEDLDRAEREPDAPVRFEDNSLGYIDDVMASLEGFTYEKSDHRGGYDTLFEPGLIDTAGPTTNPLRHVGRNDPCPCGSGKKAKKCCLAA